MDHQLAATEVYVQATEVSRSDTVEITEFTVEPTCWRRWGTGILKPDAYLVTVTPEFEDHWFIEVDRATESTTTISTKAAVYERYRRTGIEQEQSGVFPRVLWIVPDERRKAQLVDALSRRSAEDWQLHQIITDSELSNIFKP